MINELYRQIHTLTTLPKVRVQFYSDYLNTTFNSGVYDFSTPRTVYDHEDLFIPCERQLIIKMKDTDTDKHHTVTLQCEDNGLQLLSFKLGRLEIDASSEEFEGDSIVTSNKFVVKDIETEEDADPIEFFSLVIQVFDTEKVDCEY